MSVTMHASVEQHLAWSLIHDWSCLKGKQTDNIGTKGLYRIYYFQGGGGGIFFVATKVSIFGQK